MFSTTLSLCGKKFGWSLVSYFLLVKITWTCVFFTILYKGLKNYYFQFSSGKQYQREHEKHPEASTTGCSFTVTLTYPILMKTCSPWKTVLLSIFSGTLLAKYCTSTTEEREENLPLSTKYVLVSHSFGLSYEPCTFHRNKILYLEGKIILLHKT